jgi:hypothetical protein
MITDAQIDWDMVVGGGFIGGYIRVIVKFKKHEK